MTAERYSLGRAPIPSNRRERFEMLCRRRLARIPVLNHPGLQLYPGEGYRDHQFGFASGPVYDVSAVVHDLAHVVEFGDKAFRRRGANGRMVFRIPRVFIGGRFCEEPRTGQPSEREARTFGIQYRIEQRLGIAKPEEQFIQESLEAMKFISDWWHHDGPEGSARLAQIIRDSARSISDETIDRRLKDWLDAIVRQRRRNAAAVTRSQVLTA